MKKPMKGYVKYPEPKYTEVTHTPTPWSMESETIIRCSTGSVAEIKTTPANAAFIVRAVNSHEELVQELKAAVHYIKEFGGEVALNFNFLSANEVIKKAEGK